MQCIYTRNIKFFVTERNPNNIYKSKIGMIMIDSDSDSDYGSDYDSSDSDT